MNKKLIVCALFGLSGASLCAMAVGDSYKSIRRERIEDLRLFMEEHNDVFDPGVTLPFISNEQIEQLTESEKDLRGGRDETLCRFKEIRGMDLEGVSYSDIEQAEEWAEWTVNKIKVGGAYRPALKEGNALTVALLEKKMKSLLVQGPQPSKRGHRRTPSQAMPVEVQTKPKPLTTIELIDKLAPQKGDVAETADVAKLRKASPVVTSQRTLNRWMKLHDRVTPRRESRYKGGKSRSEELPGESLEE
ncbi:hypothetical protein E3J61_02180 [Candidatus Dependentiae bacterium]|nr:MAG: hypothetical protein E3J61_02180 [Candidatus Dependentiae bacterium]